MAQVDISAVTLDSIKARAAELASDVLHTPGLPLDTPLIEQALQGGSLFLKLELLQHTGTFKARGALSNARAIAPARKDNGVTAASAGNHAIATAWAARQCGMTARVVMQNTANPFRIDMARAQGAEVILRDPGPATFGEAERLAREEGMTFIHPFDSIDTVLGAAGVGLELMQDVTNLDAVIVSVGGGGLISGVASAVKLMNPKCAVYGVEPEGADTMARSLEADSPVTIEQTRTIADSLAPPMALPLGFSFCRAYVDRIVRVSDDAICAGMVVLQQEAKLAVEPAAGAAMAGLLGPLRGVLAGKRVGLIVCGANIDAEGFATFLARGRDHLDALIRSR